MICAVKHFPCDIVPQFIQRIEDGFKSPPFVMRQQAGNIFKEQILRSFNGGNSGNFKELSKNNFALVCDELKNSLEEEVYKNVDLSGNSVEPGVSTKE